MSRRRGRKAGDRVPMGAGRGGAAGSRFPGPETRRTGVSSSNAFNYREAGDGR